MDSGRLETVPAGTVHLDTVRALHQTVVSLRTALEISKNELKELKEKYEQHSHCIEYADVIEKLTIENHVLRRKIIDSGHDDKDLSGQNIKLQLTYSPRSQIIEECSSEVVIETATDQNSLTDRIDPDLSNKNSEFHSTEKLNEVEELSKSPELNASVEITSHDETHNTEIEELSQVTSFPKQENENLHRPSFKTKLELLSKFDVRIKVRTLKEGSIISSTTSDSGSSTEEKRDFNKSQDTKTRFQFEEKREQFENAEDPQGNKVNIRSVSIDNIKMAVPNEADAKTKTDKFDVQVRITSEENLVVNQSIDRSRKKETLNLDVDDLSLRSMSEGDNSVFSEGGTTPIDPSAIGADDKDQDNASGNESEEVDDIELIFTTDESKDMSNLQEDLVSIQETDQWAPQSASTTHSTPVLTKFHTLDPDFQTRGEHENQENSGVHGANEGSLRTKRVSLPNVKEIRHVAFNGKGSLDLPGRGILKSCDNKSDNMLYRKSPNASTRRLDSVDSLTCEYNRGLSFDNTKSSSFELGSSMDILHRDESMDSFHKTCHLGHRFSVFAETDISKCGISEEDLAANLNVRRNTCPNPFQYRVPAHRYGASRAVGPFKATVTPPAGAGAGAGACVGPGRARPVLRDTHAGTPRRDSGAQTDVSALPNKWSSDGYLAHKVPGFGRGVPTLPQRSRGGGGGGGAGGPCCGPCGGTSGGPTSGVRRLTAPDARPVPLVRRNDETRRVLLSDIGFTSMVPELSRSADPVWAMGRRLPPTEETSSNSTSKFLSRGSSYRSPCLSIDRSNDWIPQTVYVPATRVGCRSWRSSLPDVRRDDTEELLEEAEIFLRRSIDNLHTDPLIEHDLDKSCGQIGQPYIPAEPRHLRLGHTVKLITPQGRIAVGRVRYVGIAGGSAATSSVVVGAEFLHSQYPGIPRNDGTHRGRRYFLTPPHHTALFVPFSKIVMAWAN